MSATTPAPPTTHHRSHDLRATALTLGYDDREIVHAVDLTIAPGRVTVLVGANASGKSTLLRGIARLLTPRSGTVTLDGRDLGSMPRRSIARVIGLLPQQPLAPDGITVADLVSRGRYPHQGWIRRWSSGDDELVQQALHETDTLDLADRGLDELSGGQRQRVWIAMALAQDPDILLLDEPTSYLDIAHQIEVLDLVARLNRERGTTVVMVLHELSLAARYADEMVVMCDGNIVGQGTPGEVLTEATVREAFGLESRIVPDPVTGTPLVVPIARALQLG
ncbi:MAG TPA: ABC transporter ATP-binding protein [Pseudolysinimonas sp.]|nr:ABC transporter ATP-binding protein [Pseudolysinimonas sp.]